MNFQLFFLYVLVQMNLERGIWSASSPFVWLRVMRLKPTSPSASSTSGFGRTLVTSFLWYAQLTVVSNSPPLSNRSEEHTSELQSLMRISYAVFCLNKKTPNNHTNTDNNKVIHKH